MPLEAAMPDLLLWQERQIKKMRQEMNDIFDRICRDFSSPTFPCTTQPDFHIQETNDTIVVRSKLCNIDSGELQVTVSEDFLQIRGVRHKDIVWQNSAVGPGGSFFTKIRLPGKVDPNHTRASFVNNILKIVMPRYQRGVMKRINIDTE
jgi:HSP20 family molecular chaperone IbpA